jgi:phenylacetate-CoA ligase
MSIGNRLGSGRNAESEYMFEPDVETMPKEKLARLQFERLKKTLRYAYENVAPIKRRFDQAGVAPGDLKSLEDIAKFPFTLKDDLRENYPFGLFAVPLGKVARFHASSGTTTGRPTVVGYTRDDLDTWSNLMARSLACAGARPGDILHNAFGYGLFTGGLGFHYGAERLGCTVTPASGGNTLRQALVLRDFGATVLCCAPSYALHIAEVAEQNGIELRGGPLRLGIFGAEPWSEAMRNELQVRFGIAALDLYGLSEIMGPGVAVECHGTRYGLHGWEDHFLFEIVDPKTGQPLPTGESGELVITTLSKQALPMIRYRTRDITKLTTESCACQRTCLRILRVAGRTDDMMIIRGVNVYPSQVEEVLVALPTIAPHYQLVIKRDGALDILTVEVEAMADSPETSYSAIADQVAHHVKSIIGVTCAVEVKRPGELPRWEGKATRVRDLRKQQGLGA